MSEDDSEVRSSDQEKDTVKIYEYNPADKSKKSKSDCKVEESKKVYKTTALAFEAFNKKLFTPATSADEKSSANIHIVQEPSSSSKVKKFESAHERLARIKREHVSFKASLDALAAGDSIKAISESEGKDSVVQEIDRLEMEFGAILNDVRISPFMPNNSPFPKSTLNRPHSEITKSMIPQINTHSGAGLSGCTYELIARKKAGDKELRLNEVERRINALEARVGKIDKKTGFKSMHDALRDLYNKLELLQGNNIDGLTRKIASTNTELQLQQHLLRIKGAKGGQKLITELHKVFQGGEKNIKSLPDMVAKLQKHNEKHKAQTQALLRLQKLQRMQLGLKSILTQDKETLAQVSENLGQNMEILKKNIDCFKQRFAALNKSLDSL